MLDERLYIRDNFTTLQRNYKKYAAINLLIKGKAAQLVRFLFNRVQLRLWELFLEDWRANKPLRWYIVKSRQLGSTTWFLGLIYWLLTLRANMAAVFVAHNEKAAKEMGIKVQYLHFKGKPELRPEVRTMNREQIHFATPLEKMQKTGDPGLDSIIDIYTGDSDGIGRSRTYQLAVVTELGTMADMGMDIPKMMEALGNCIAEIPGTGIFIETTATGDNYAKDFWEDETNGYRKIFIPRVADESYRVDLKRGEYFELSRNPNAKYGDEVEEFENVKAALVEWYSEFKLFETSERVRLDLTHEAYCRMAWRRRMLDTKFFDPDYAIRRIKFKYEYPTTPHDAFAANSKTIFSITRILEREDELKRRKTTPTMYQFDRRTTNSERSFYQTEYGNLRIFEPPIPGQRYAIGGDAAQGIDGGDDSALVVLKLPSLVEVASLNDIVVPSEFAGIAYNLGMLYNKALVGIELNDKGGYAALKFLDEILHYPNLWYVEDQNPADIRYGWITNGPTRSVMISEAKDLIAEKQVRINSKELIAQLKTFVDLGNGKYGALPGKHDDLAMAFMIAIQIAKSVHIPKPYEKPKTPPKGSPDYIIEQLKKRNSKFARV